MNRFHKKVIDAFDSSNKQILQTEKSWWTLDNMGSIVIPKKGMIISLNPNTFILCRKIINHNEKSAVTAKNGKYFIKDNAITTYRFKQDYYFMMGDNRNATFDSRCWGFLPETHIIGKVQCVLFSNKDGKFQWERFFKIL